MKRASRALLACATLSLGAGVLVEGARADRAEDGRLVTLRSGPASPVAIDLGGPLREGRLARTLAGDHHAVLEQTAIPRRATAPVEWASYIAMGTLEGLTVRLLDARVRTVALGPVDVRPVVLPSGELLVALRDGRVVILDRTLETRVETRLAAGARPSPLVLPDGSIVMVTTDRRLTRLDADLAPMFSVPLSVGTAGLTHAPAFLPPDRLVLAAVDRLCVLDLGGHLLFATDLGDRISAPPVVTPEGTIHVLLAGGHIAVVEHARHVRQRLPLGGRVLDQSAVLARDDDGSYRVAVPTLGVVAIAADGTTLWTTATDAPFHGPLGIDASHRTLAFDRRGRLGVISPSGELLERIELGGITNGFPMVASDGTLWATTDAAGLVHVGVPPRPTPMTTPALEVTGVTLGPG